MQNLKELIDWTTLKPLSRNSGGHDDHMKLMFKGATLLGHWNENYYQGTVMTAVKLEDGRFVFYSDSYGSCSGCDMWEDCDDDQLERNVNDVVGRAEIFNSLDSLVERLSQDPEEFEFELLTEMRKNGVVA